MKNQLHSGLTLKSIIDYVLVFFAAGGISYTLVSHFVFVKDFNLLLFLFSVIFLMKGLTPTVTNCFKK
ncbi:hypothetical protein NU09_3111 [Flavobacterium beibuense]|uniref:Uncharacterized protein n=1 Tax=Flavobacterium beibuense TaxID=657326 RepID=A0A444W6R5_9FLAO|nr:hypothetical protein NU09_3111 [Flavobacterium beibuense]